MKRNVLIQRSALLVCVFALANCTNDKTHSVGGYAKDNSAQNTHNAAQPTAENQKENEADLKTTQQIRQAVVEDDTLSITGKNVKIITANGFVTLRGPVKSLQEKASIGDKAERIAGIAKVDNQLEVINP